VIVVVGNPIPRASPGGILAGGPAAFVALSAAAAGSEVQLVARVVDDPVGDAMLLHLAEGGVSHVATLRQPATPEGPILEAADLELALRYLTNVGVLVLAEPDPRLVAVAVEAADWNHAALVAILSPDAPVPDDLPSDTTVLASPDTDPDGAFGSLVGAYAAALDRGVDPASAFRTTITEATAWAPVLD
jgi:sugar/nucleoside kinase (ribokinase family)